jgi:hypothetical protein
VIVSVWKSSQKITGTKSNDRLFFNARDTVEKFQDFSQFENKFGELTKLLPPKGGRFGKRLKVA